MKTQARVLHQLYEPRVSLLGYDGQGVDLAIGEHVGNPLAVVPLDQLDLIAELQRVDYQTRQLLAASCCCPRGRCPSAARCRAGWHRRG